MSNEQFWLSVGFVGQVFFSMRFLVALTGGGQPSVGRGLSLRRAGYEAARKGQSGTPVLLGVPLLAPSLGGYGTRRDWALGWLCLLTVVCGLLYLWTDPTQSISDAIRYSLAVTTLQKRDDPSDLGGWIKVFQTVVGAVLVALFVLAVRMRLKR